MQSERLRTHIWHRNLISNVLLIAQRYPEYLLYLALTVTCASICLVSMNRIYCVVTYLYFVA